MADTIKKISIVGAGSDAKEIGAEAQNVEVSYDIDGNIIPDIHAPGAPAVASTESLTVILQDTSPENHADPTTKYGAASTTQFGHMKVGTGLEVAAGVVSVDFGTRAGTACEGDDERLSNDRKNPEAVIFSGGTSIINYDGSVQRSVNYDGVGAAKKNHASRTNEFGMADKSNYGHVRIGDGLENRGNSLSLSIATNNSLGGVIPDNDTIKIDADGTIHSSGGTGGSILEIRTLEPELYNQTVTITCTAAGIDPVETQFDNSGYAIVRGYMGTGTVTASASGGGQSSFYSKEIQYFGKYEFLLTFWYGTITITNEDKELKNQILTVYKDGEVIGNTAFNSNGEAQYVAHSRGTYNFKCKPDYGVNFNECWRTFEADHAVELQGSSGESGETTISGFVATINISTNAIPEFDHAVIEVNGYDNPQGMTIPSQRVTFNNEYNAIYKAYAPGKYYATVTHEGEDYQSKNDATSINSGDIKSLAVDMWTATVEVETEDFANMSMEIYEIVNATNPSTDIYVGSTTFDNSGVASYRVHKPGLYEFRVPTNE